MKKRDDTEGKQSKENVIYGADCQLRSDKLALSLLVGVFFSFNLMFFAPFDLYLSNIDSLSIPMRYMLRAFIPTAVILFIAVFLICFLTVKKYHVAAVSLVFGISLAMFIQGSYLSGNMGEIDGTRYSTSAGRVVINTVIWLFIIAVPFLIYKFNRPFYKNVLAYMSFALLLIEIVTISATLIKITVDDENTQLDGVLGESSPYICSTEGEFTYSANKNYIIFITDEYDSFCYDSAVETEPDCISGFDGFTYYKNTVGMYSSTPQAVSHILTGVRSEDDLYTSDDFFDAVKENYKMNIYAEYNMFPERIYSSYAENYYKKELTSKSFIKLHLAFDKLTMFKYMPEALKGLFRMSGNEFADIFIDDDLQSYDSDDLAFYNSLDSSFELTDDDCFKLIYIKGLHDPVYITSDLQEMSEWGVKAEEQAIAVNKILSRYFDKLKENGVYDNSEIVLLADHGIKGHNAGKYPLLMIKRAGASGNGVTVSNAPISYEDVYPTLMHIAGEIGGKNTVFDIAEDEERVRYFASTDEYITQDIK